MKPSLSILTLVFALLVFFVSCGGSKGSGDEGSGNNDSAETGSIYGVVSDKATGEPIINAGVELHLVESETIVARTATGSDGYFATPEISEGEYDLLVTKIGYIENKRTVYVKSAKQTPYNVHLEKNSALQIFDDDDKNEISELDFGDKLDDVSRSFNIRNVGSESFEWEITKTAEWIKSISQESGKLAAGDTQGIIVEINRSLLPERENLTRIHITAINNGDKQLTIKATDLDPCSPNPCSDKENSTGICNIIDEKKYSCECKDTFTWNDSKCLNPCSPNPCLLVENSTGECTKIDNFTLYSCGCTENYTWNETLCTADSRSADCTGLPNNAEWNTASSITQTWSGSEWFPTTDGTFNEEESVSECRFKCKTNYDWNESTSTCDAATQQANCSSKPENTVWNDNGNNGKFTQTWSGSAWAPASYNSSYNESAGTCRYKCTDNYHYETGQCIYDIKTAVFCTGLPNNANWNIVSNIDQSWNGFEWVPSASGTYTEEESMSECRFKCDNSYYWHNSECINPCDYNPCEDVKNSTKVCTAISWQDYLCGCNSGYFWNGSECKKQTPLGNICTGQDKCYNESAEITYPTLSTADFYGQDAQYMCKCTEQSFTVGSGAYAGTVIDNNTGLIWEQSPSEETYTWDDAPNHCADLNSSNYGGKSNWRVPNPSEFLTIVDNSKYNPATNSNFANMSYYLWTSKECDGNSLACAFDPDDGNYWTYQSKNKTYKVLCVSGNELNAAASGDFTIQTINGAVVVKDSITGLMWQKEYTTDKTWQQALRYCEDSTYAGYSDWRLPNKNELASLLDPSKSGAPYSNFPDMPSYRFWSSSTSYFHANPDVAWFAHFNFGQMQQAYKSIDDVLSVRCVRSEPINDPCASVANSTGVCIQQNPFKYSCGCSDGYFWNGSECQKQITLGNICTGQTKCYKDNMDDVIACPTSPGADFYGQDAQNRSKCAKHDLDVKTISSDKIVVDNNTGLIWEQRAALNTYTWDNAANRCNDLNNSNYGGINSWRVPNPLELLTIVDSDTQFPALDTLKFLGVSEEGYLWTSKDYGSDGRYLETYVGKMGWGSKSTDCNVLCVSGEELRSAVASDFEASSDGKIVTDKRTGLMWQSEDVPNKYWREALAYCQSLNGENYGGYSDWRLPNKNELASLLNYDKYDSPFSYFPNISNKIFCTSTTSRNVEQYAWLVAFNGGYVYTYEKSSSLPYYVKCVRSDVCGDGNFWNGSKCQKQIPLGNICTGQDKCYNTSFVVEECPISGEDFFGQDAQYISKCIAQSFTADTDKGIVVDNNTGLTWEMSPSEEVYTWDDAPNHCVDLSISNYGGKTNWRVPNPLELQTIVDNSIYNPSTNSNFTGMPTDDMGVYFWTSKEYKGNTSYAYIFQPYSGLYYGWTYDTYLKTKTYKVLCVSGDEMRVATSANFTLQTLSGKVVVTDSVTGLMWQKEYSLGATWQQALKYCEDSTYAGYSDWRLPNKNELASLVNYEKSEKPYSYFPADMSDFWSSSTLPGSTDAAWAVRFGTGTEEVLNKSYAIPVRCVRNE